MQASFDLPTVDEKVRLHKEASQCYFPFVRTHAEPRRERNVFNSLNFCAAAKIPGTTEGLSLLWDERSQKENSQI